jgi:hypothetical protein
MSTENISEEKDLDVASVLVQQEVRKERGR